MKFHFWHTFLSFFFLALAVLGLLWLDASGSLSSWVPLADFVLMALAVQRLVRLFTYDNIPGFVREWFKGEDPESFLGSLGTLINCPWCTGLWFSLIIVFFYFLTPYAWYGILVLALSSTGSFIQLLANYLGWAAEAKKREAESNFLPR